MAKSELFKKLERERREREGRGIPAHKPLPPKSAEELKRIKQQDEMMAYSARYFIHHDAEELCEEEYEEEGID